MKDEAGSGIGEIRTRAEKLLHAKGPQSVHVCTVSGLPILHVAREEADLELDSHAAWAAELANRLFHSARELTGRPPLRAEIRTEEEALLLLRDDPFVLVITFPPVAGKKLGGSREDGLLELIESLHEELN